MVNFFFDQKKIFIVTLIFYLFFLKFNNISDGFWYDEWHTFYYSNPTFIEKGNLIELVRNSVAPPLYFILNSIVYKIFGYEPEIGRNFSFFFNILSFVTLYLILKNNFSKKKQYFVLSGYLLNYSIIIYSYELRFYSFNTFILLINIFFFFKIVDCLNKKNIIIYFVTSLICLSSNYFLLPIILFQFMYLLFLKKNFQIFLIFSLFFIVFFITNQIHLSEIQNLSQKDIWGTFSYSFFLGYFFNIFFGYKILGLIVLLSIFFISVIKINQIFFDKKLLFILSFIIITYIFFILYSVIFTPVLRPRYFLHIVPLIILVFFLLIDYISYKKQFLIISIFFLISFVRIYFFSMPFDKPDTNDMIKIIKKLEVPVVLNSTKDKFFNNYLINSHSFKKNNIISFTNDKLDLINPDFFAEICLNNPTFKTSMKNDDLKCLKNNYSNNFIIFNNFKTKDYIINLYSKI